VGETPGEPELQYQRGFFIVPAAPSFVNEGRLPQAWILEWRLGRRLSDFRLANEANRAK